MRMNTPDRCDDDAEAWKTERIEHAEHELETGDDPGDSLTHSGEIDLCNGHVLADDYYDKHVRQRLDSIPNREVSRPTDASNAPPNAGQVTSVSSAIVCSSWSSLDRKPGSLKIRWPEGALGNSVLPPLLISTEGHEQSSGLGDQRLRGDHLVELGQLGAEAGLTQDKVDGTGLAVGVRCLGDVEGLTDGEVIVTVDITATGKAGAQGALEAPSTERPVIVFDQREAGGPAAAGLALRRQEPVEDGIGDRLGGGIRRHVE